MSTKKKMFKILILGNAGVGKTSLMYQYVKQKFTQQYRATVGADFMAKDVVVDDKEYTLQIWDTAGQDRFQALGAAFYRGTDCCVLVYDITDQKSFDDLDQWRREFLQQGNTPDPDNFPFIVIGNKLDKANSRQVQEEKVKNWSNSYQKQMKYFECSAKDATNVEAAFQQIAISASLQEKDDIFIPNTIKLEKSRPAQNKDKSGCC